jgi:hypothetical protein
MRNRSVIDSIDDYKSAVYLSIYRGGDWTLYKLISRANSVNLANNRSIKLETLICSAYARTVRVTPGFKGQSRVHLIHAPKKTTYIITECIEINVTNHQSIYYIAEDLLQNKSVNIKRTKDRRRQCRLRNAT